MSELVLAKPKIVGITTTPEKMRVDFAQRTGTILNRNEQDRKNSDDNWKKDEDIKLVGRVPRIVWMLWQQLGITEDENELARALERNSEYKTTEKRLI